MINEFIIKEYKTNYLIIGIAKRNHLWLLTVLCTLAIFSGQVGFKPQFTGGVKQLVNKKNVYYYLTTQTI